MHTHEIVRVLYALMMLYTCWLHICMSLHVYTRERTREREKGEVQGMHTHKRERVRERKERGTGKECIHTRESA